MNKLDTYMLNKNMYKTVLILIATKIKLASLK